MYVYIVKCLRTDCVRLRGLCSYSPLRLGPEYLSIHLNQFGSGLLDRFTALYFY